MKYCSNGEIVYCCSVRHQERFILVTVPMNKIVNGYDFHIRYVGTSVQFWTKTVSLMKTRRCQQEMPVCTRARRYIAWSVFRYVQTIRFDIQHCCRCRPYPTRKDTIVSFILYAHTWHGKWDQLPQQRLLLIKIRQVARKTSQVPERKK